MVSDDPESFADLDGHADRDLEKPTDIACLGDGDCPPPPPQQASPPQATATQQQAQNQACTNATCGDQAPPSTISSIATGELKEIHNESRDMAISQGLAGNPLALLIGLSMKEKSASNSKEKLGMLLTAIGMMFAGAVGEETATAKAVNLPKWKTIGIDMEHILSGHTKGGARAAQSGIKSLFPKEWSAKQIERAVREAYRHGAKAGAITRGVVAVEGKGGGLNIKMYVNIVAKIIRTAWPE